MSWRSVSVLSVLLVGASLFQIDHTQTWTRIKNLHWCVYVFPCAKNKKAQPCWENIKHYQATEQKRRWEQEQTCGECKISTSSRMLSSSSCRRSFFFFDSNLRTSLSIGHQVSILRRARENTDAASASVTGRKQTGTRMDIKSSTRWIDRRFRYALYWELQRSAWTHLPSSSKCRPCRIRGAQNQFMTSAGK